MVQRAIQIHPICSLWKAAANHICRSSGGVYVLLCGLCYSAYHEIGVFGVCVVKPKIWQSFTCFTVGS